LINSTIEKLVIKAAEVISDQCQNTCHFELKKAQEKMKSTELNCERIKKEYDANMASYTNKIEDANRSKMQFEAQNMLLAQKVSQMEQDYQGKEAKLKASMSEKEAEFSKKIQDNKEKMKKLEELVTEKEKELIRSKGEYEKKIALDQQQLKYLETRQKEQSLKIESLQQEIKNYKIEVDGKTKQISVN